MVVTKGDAVIIANNYAFNSGETKSADTSGYHRPAVCLSVDNLGGLTDDTVTIEIVGDATTYTVDERTVSSTDEYVVDVPQAGTVQVTSANGATISAEARNNPR